jgi:hypothetical protein
MKLLENPKLTQISEALSGYRGDALVTCRIESYSCKMAGMDKKWSVDGDCDALLAYNSAFLSMTRLRWNPSSDAYH